MEDNKIQRPHRISLLNTKFDELSEAIKDVIITLDSSINEENAEYFCISSIVEKLDLVLKRLLKHHVIYRYTVKEDLLSTRRIIMTVREKPRYKEIFIAIDFDCFIPWYNNGV